jgi:hypothetical protein
MTYAVYALLALAGLSLGLRATSVLLDSRLHPLARFAVSIVIGAALVLVTLEVCDKYHVLDLGIGLLLSLSPVGLFDLAKWWFRWRRSDVQA